MKYFFVLVLAASVFFSGCSTVKPPPFNEQTDEFKIETAVIGYMLERPVWKPGEYGAIFLKGDDDEVAALIRRFPNHEPPIRPSDRVMLQPNRTPIDKDTGRPAIILSADVPESFGGEAEALGQWYAGPAVTGHYVFKLKKVGEEWKIESAQ